MLPPRILRLITAFHVMIYRWSKGRIGGSVRRISVLLLTTTGRKSGKQRTTPLGYIRDEENYIIIASYSGFGRKPSWFHNLKANPEATIEVKGERVFVEAVQADEGEQERLWARVVEQEPSFEMFQKRTDEPIPIFILKPMR